MLLRALSPRVVEIVITERRACSLHVYHRLTLTAVGDEEEAKGVFVCLVVPYTESYSSAGCVYGILYSMSVSLVSYIACIHTLPNGAPLLELSWYPFSKYTNFTEDSNLASSLLHKSLREI